MCWDNLPADIVSRDTKYVFNFSLRVARHLSSYEIFYKNKAVGMGLIYLN
jgi:hypothetical protein